MSRIRHFFKAGFVVVGITLAAVSLGSCNLAKNQMTFDRSNNKNIQDYKDGLSPEHKSVTEAPSVLPDFQSVVSTPADLKLPSPLVTVSVNQTVSLRDLMFELAEKAGVDLEMDPGIHGSIIFTAKDRPFNDVVDRICDMTGLRYTFENNVLKIEIDRPYIKDYKVDYMSISRTSSSDVKTSISTGGSGSAGATTESKSGSSATVKNDNKSDFWVDIEAGLKQVLAASDNYTSLASQDDPAAVPEPPPPPPVQGGDPNAAKAAPVVPSNVPPTLNIAPQPSAPRPANSASTYSISKQTGIVSVFTSERQHKLVQKFFDSYRRAATTQVLIEAKVLEVSLDDQYASGIDWPVLGANLTRLIPSATVNFSSPGIQASTFSTAGTFSTNLDLGHGFKPVIQALSQFGTVSALSSPRVTVMNNQSAIVNVAKSIVYFTISATTTPTTTQGGQPTTSFTSTQLSVPDGVLMNVTPTVNLDTGEIMLAVRPTISKKVGSANDPSLALNIAQAYAPNSPPQNVLDAAVSAIPEMSVQEIDSIIKMQSGQTMVMGGLMKDGNTATQQGVPVIGDVPFLGNLFNSHQDEVTKSELVIFLKATVMPGSNVQEMDRKVYKKFGNDTRPFEM